MSPRLQKQISNDVRNRWRSVRDQFRKYHNERGRSGSSPPRRPFVYSDQLQFLISGRELRETDGNINAPETETEENMLASSDSAGDFALSQETVAGPSQASGQTEIRPPMTSEGVPPLPRQRARSSSRSILPRAVEKETLELIQRVDKEDHWDQLGATIAARVRQLPSNRQWVCVPAVFELLTYYSNTHQIPTNLYILGGLKNIFEPNVNTPAVEGPQFFHHPGMFQPIQHRFHGDNVRHSAETQDGSVRESTVSTQSSFLGLLNSPIENTSVLTQNTYSTPSTEVTQRQTTSTPPMSFPPF
ncbi:uncharacterized protein [Dendropsophus ebraccatus]|uniref:uncharacterized protein n=1 Tax=Dendropsophus ebraccatus TaxID=150705 RepID=UPI00383199E8